MQERIAEKVELDDRKCLVGRKVTVVIIEEALSCHVECLAGRIPLEQFGHIDVRQAVGIVQVGCRTALRSTPRDARRPQVEQRHVAHRREQHRLAAAVILEFPAIARLGHHHVRFLGGRQLPGRDCLVTLLLVGSIEAACGRGIAAVQVEIVEVRTPVENLVDDRTLDAGADKKVLRIDTLIEPHVAPEESIAAERLADRSRGRKPREIGLPVSPAHGHRTGGFGRAAQVSGQVVQRRVMRQRQASRMEILFVLENFGRPQHGVSPLAQQVGIRDIGVDVRIAVIGIGDILRQDGHGNDIGASDDEQVVGFIVGRAAPETVIVRQQVTVFDPRIGR